MASRVSPQPQNVFTVAVIINDGEIEHFCPISTPQIC